MPREVGNGPQSVEARLERLGWREREFRGGLDTLPRPGETTFEDEDFANCFIVGGTVAPSSAVATTAETAAPVAGTAGEELDGGEVRVDGRDAETSRGGRRRRRRLACRRGIRAASARPAGAEAGDRVRVS